MIKKIFSKNKIRKSISPLIASILIIVVVVAVIGVILLWGKNFTNESLTSTYTFSEDKTVSDFVWQDDITGKNLFIKNTHTSLSKTIIGYKINSSLDYAYLNKYHYLDESFLLSKNSIAQLTLGCVPEKNFSIELLTDSNEYISFPVTSKFFDASECTFSFSITSPLENSINSFESTINFNSTITNASGTPTCLWSSDIDGNLSTDCDFSTSSLTANTHIITLQVTDSGDTQDTNVSILVKDGLVPTINTPLNNSGSLFGNEVSFTSTVDNNYGVYSCSWDSNRDGSLGTDCNFNISSLSVGTHLISLSVTDNLETVSTTKTITVKTSLVLSIDSPSTDSTFAENNNINFIGSATNTFGSYSCSWDSNRDGSLGSFCDFNISNLSIGAHLITLSVTDDLETVSTTKNVIIKTSLIPSIDSPGSGATFSYGDSINFTGSATNTYGSYTCAWSSSIDGSLGNECVFNISNLSIGTHTITLSVTDSLETISTTISLIVVFSCPTGYILVPGNATYSLSDFCVSKYQMKMDMTGDGVGDLVSAYPSCAAGSLTDNTLSYQNCSSSGTLVSTKEGSPVAQITQTESIAACSAIGGHLITNEEWMTIARNIESVPSNWSTGVVGSGYIYSGHNDSAPNGALEASTDNDGYYGTGQTTGNQRRTLTLSNGEVIWDLAGNVYQWVDKTITRGNMPPVGTGYLEYTAVTNYGPEGRDAYNFEVGKEYTSSNGIGMLYNFYLAGSTTENAFMRGGSWSNTSSAGVLSLNLYRGPSFQSISLGLRCVK